MQSACIRSVEAFSLLAATLVSFGCSRPTPGPDPATAAVDVRTEPTAFEKMTGHSLVEPSAFVRLRPGMTQREAIDLLGTAGLHEFTYRKDNRTYVLTTYYAGMGSEPKSAIHFHGLYRDDSLLRVLRSLPKNLERYAYRGTTASRQKTWPVEDESRIHEILSLPGLSGREVSAVIDQYLQPLPQSEPQIPPFLVHSLATMTGYSARIAKGYERNRELLHRFDGHRIELGMSRAKVDALLGDPAHVEAITPTLSLSIYAIKLYGDAPDERLEINPLYQFSPLAVVFKNGETARVYSQGFISRDWMPDGSDYGL